MRTIFLALVFWGVSSHSVIAQGNPFPKDSPEYQVYNLYLTCSPFFPINPHDCVNHYPEVAKLYDSTPKHTMAMEIFYYYFASIACETESREKEAEVLGRLYSSLLTEYRKKKNQFWDDEEAWYMQGMDKIDKTKLTEWIDYVTGSRFVSQSTDILPPAFPQFPFPPPQSSTRNVLDRDIFQNCYNLNDVSQMISHALDKCDYEKSFYSIPNGFALVARLEQFNGENAISFPAPDRWAASLPPLRDFSEYLKALFFPQEGHYRIVAFLVTDQPFYEQNRVVQQEEAIGWLKSGLNVLPDVIGKVKWTEAFQCTALIYEFKVTTARQKGELVASKFSAQTHLEKSNLLFALKNAKK